MSMPRVLRRLTQILLAVLAAFGRPYQPDPPERTAVVLHAEQSDDGDRG
jgi:hypothetical protein